MNFIVLPDLIALTILVVVFRAVAFRTVPFRTVLLHGAVGGPQLWLTGWVLVIIHFVAEFVDIGQGLWDRLATAVSLDTLELASIAFLVSVSPLATNRRRVFVLAATIGIPAIIYTNAVIWGPSTHSFYYGVIAVAILGALSLVRNLHGGPRADVIGLSIGCLGLSCAMVAAVARGTPDLGIVVLLTGLNFIVATLYWRRYRRAKAAALTTVFGFVAWGAVFPTGTLLGIFAPSVHLETQVWEIPKYLVLAGMILTLLPQQIEQLSAAAEADLPALIARGESAEIEFKSTFRWDLRENKLNRALEVVVLKTVAGYMNAKGGTLLIGVADDRSIVGLDNDYRTLKNRDVFEQVLMTDVATKLGGDVSDKVRVVFASLENKDVCRVIVSPAHRPVYLKAKDGDSPKFHLRMGVMTSELNVQDAVNYISTHWPKYRS